MFPHARIACGVRPVLSALLLCLAGGAAGAQPPLPVLRAHSPTLNVREGHHRWKGIWTAEPSVPLDIYYAQRSATSRAIAFYSDLDSLAFEVAPGRDYDFVILLDDTIRCRTRISTFRQSARRAAPGPGGGAVEIPFTIGRNHKPYVTGRLNGSKPLRLMFDTGAATTVIFPSALRKQVRVAFDGVIENAGTGGTVTRRTSNDNTLEIADLSWAHIPVLYVEKQTDPGEGIVGIDVFEDKVVELDCDRGVMTVRDSLPTLEMGFERFELEWRGTLPLLRSTLHTGAARITDAFVLNTGSSGTVSVNQDFAARHGLRRSLVRLGTARVSGVGRRTSRADRMLLPALSIGGIELHAIPIVVEQPSPQGRQFGDMLGMEILSRFDLILDFRNDAVYLRPARSAARPFRRYPGPHTTAVAMLVTVPLVAGAVWFGWHRLRRSADA
jgi:predicted aspartyl protease